MKKGTPRRRGVRRGRRRIRRLTKKQLEARAKRWARETFCAHYSLEVIYWGFDVAKDRAITKAVGHASEGSGMLMLADLRDVRFDFKTERSALAAVRRVRKAVRGVRFMMHSSRKV